MIIGDPQLPERYLASEAIDALDRDERTIALFTDDPHQWISLLQAVHNFLYQPHHLNDDFYRNQLALSHNWIIDSIRDTCDMDEEEEAESCPTCGSDDPASHPVRADAPADLVGVEGEVTEDCPDPWHSSIDEAEARTNSAIAEMNSGEQR